MRTTEEVLEQIRARRDFGNRGEYHEDYDLNDDEAKQELEEYIQERIEAAKQEV